MTHEQVEQLRDAIVDKFTQSDLEQLLYLKLGKNLATISRSGSNYNGVAFDVVRTAQREDWIDALITELQKARPTETVFTTLAESHQEPTIISVDESRENSHSPLGSASGSESPVERVRDWPRWIQVIMVVTGLFLVILVSFVIQNEVAPQNSVEQE